MKLARMLACLLLLACASCTNNAAPPISPLIAAARVGDAAQIAQLVGSGADVNQRGGVNSWTPLMHAVHTNQLAAVRALLDAGADVNATAGARKRDTALSLAIVQNEPEIAALLRAHGGKAL